MTKLIKIGCCLIFLSQSNEYSFNCKLTYEVTDLKNQKKNHIISYLINEQDNSYNSTLLNSSSNTEEITFIDQNGSYWKGQLVNPNVKKSVITLDKKQLEKYSNPYKYQVDNYDFVELKDTLLDHKNCKRFMLKSNDEEKEQKKKLGREIYIIDPSSNVQPLLTFSTAYEVWKSRKNIPNGIIIEKYFYNYKGEMVTKEKLKSKENISLKFIFDSE
jgi:hypothetical protein